jgi:hypothetical protein
VAEGLGAWLAQVIQAVEPWISSGIAKGALWRSEVAERLDEAKVGIVCLTSSNLTAPWILFEAGALSKTKDSYVCTFLLDITPTDVEPPLGDFQHTLFTKEDVLKLIQTINGIVKNSGERSLTDQILTKMFDTFWPQLETQLTEIKNHQEVTTVPRPERELLEEMLEILRSQEQRARKERDEEKAAIARALDRMDFGNLAAPPGSGAVQRYQKRVGQVGGKGPSARTEPFKKKEPSEE